MGSRDLASKVILPKSLAIPLCYDPTEYPLCHGGFADVWKGQYNGRDVAAKVLRIYLTSDFDRIRRVSSSQILRVYELTVSHVEILQGGNDVGRTSPPKRVAVVGGDNERESVCDGIGMDGERYHQ